MFPFKIFRIDAVRGMGGPEDDHIGIHFGIEDLIIVERIMWTGLIIHPIVYQN
jgi:hypothetical protein